MRYLFTAFILFAAGLPSSAHQDKAKDAKQETKKADGKSVEDKIPLLPIKVQVTDATGGPVPGAKVTPQGLRARAARGSHYMWNVQAHGKAPTVVTDEKGIAELVYPKFITEKLETGEVTWFVDHSDYVQFYEDRDVGDVAKITLKSGFRIAATAVGPDGERIKKDLFALQSGPGGAWEMKKGGILTSRVFDRKQSSLRMVYMPQDGPVLYSDLKYVYPKPDQGRVFLRNIELKQGCRVEGKIDDAVPRPVTNGAVVCVIVVPGAPGPDGDEASWSFNTGAKINADGTFVFASLPRGEAMQLLVVCDGWVSKQPDLVRVKEQFPELLKREVAIGSQRYPQVFRVADGGAQPLVAMEKTGTARLTLKGPEGEALQNTMVHMWPNQIFFSYGSQILGSNYDTLEALRARRDGKKVQFAGFPRRYSAKTNEQGIVTIKNLPGPASLGVAVQHSKFVLPVENGQRSTSIRIKPGEVAEKSFNLRERGEDEVWQ